MVGREIVKLDGSLNNGQGRNSGMILSNKMLLFKFKRTRIRSGFDFICAQKQILSLTVNSMFVDPSRSSILRAPFRA